MNGLQDIAIVDLSTGSVTYEPVTPSWLSTTSAARASVPTCCIGSSNPASMPSHPQTPSSWPLDR